jgi:hypothetical protein
MRNPESTKKISTPRMEIGANGASHGGWPFE